VPSTGAAPTTGGPGGDDPEAMRPWHGPSARRNPRGFLVGNGFAHEGRSDADRTAFLAEETPRIKAKLPPGSARACLDQIAAPRLP
jgi:hypothetical protein